MNKKTLGGAALLVAGGFIGRETLVWAFNKTLDALSSGFRDGVSFAGLSWQNGVATSLIIVGIVLIVWPKPKPAEPLDDSYELLTLSANIVDRVRQHRGAKWFERDRLEPTTDIARAALAALLTFKKAGFQTPQLQFDYAENVAIGAEAYFAALFQLLNQGHRTEAIAFSSTASEHALKVASRFDPNQWFPPDV